MISTPSPSPDQKDIVGQHTRYVGVNIPPTLLQKIVRLGAIVKTFNRTRTADAAVVQSSLDIPKLDLILEGRLACTILSATMHVFQIIMAQFKLRRQGKVYMADTFGPEDFYGGKEPFIFSTSRLSRSVLSLVGWWDGEILVGLSILSLEHSLKLLHSTGPSRNSRHILCSQRDKNYIDLVSLFGPHCGRIAQARYDRHGGKLEPRISQIFFFATTDDTASNTEYIPSIYSELPTRDSQSQLLFTSL
ncbi:hypothetical protein N7455_007541 [Penicillium solitum]|uniref:uncharacterized protein n=1 Tax=Penicillium solitum TaxID=60172 RepID=UPI0032C4696C|nr:hypothetical protein N7455_007541 [Penicillium solitum]